MTVITSCESVHNNPVFGLLRLLFLPLLLLLAIVLLLRFLQWVIDRYMTYVF